MKKNTLHTLYIGVIAFCLFWVKMSSAINVTNCPNGTTMLTQGSSSVFNIQRNRYHYLFQAVVTVTLNCDLDEPIQGVNASATVTFSTEGEESVTVTQYGATAPEDPPLQKKGQTKQLNFDFSGYGYSGWEMSIPVVRILGADFDTLDN